MKKLRGGRWDLISIAVFFLVLIILILSMGESFIPNNPNPGWRLSRLNPFQSSDGHLRYPPVYYLVFSKRTCMEIVQRNRILLVGSQSSRE